MEPTEPSALPPLYMADVTACQFSSWYPRFKRHAPKATIIRPIPHEDELLEYLESDGLFLPEGSGPNGISELSDSESNDGDASDDDGSSSASIKQFSFPQLDAEIRLVLARYEGAVFPKLNWSSPQDAAWMIPGQNLKCQHPADVYLLLKSSDFISHDLDHAFDECIDSPAATSASPPSEVSHDAPRIDTLPLEDIELTTSASSKRVRRPYSFELVLKKWFDMPKSQEWRCFVRDRRLVGISQRDTTFYDFLQPESAQSQIRDQIESFWTNTVKGEFPIANYTLDVYLTRDHSRTFIVDFNPYSASTDALLFTYPELSTLAATTNERPVLRIVASEAAGALPRYSHNRYPKDVVELSEGQSVADFAKVWGEKIKNAAVDQDSACDGQVDSDSLLSKAEETVGR
ncbi:cell proliferation protein CDC123 [Sporobolomyces koalae]|uniref:cell proliferation protein CDC123 n=1 Tax=Sporobolomyces koalae TaxID=500713 RepID=UPI00316CD37E